MRKNKRSQKHHYLPVKYLKGFVDNKGLFFIYDKKEDRILPEPLPAKKFFFENNLNTVSLPNGKISDFLEDLYSDTEYCIWKSLDNIRLSSPDNIVSYWDKLHIYLFLLDLHWRLPSNIAHADRISQKFLLGNKPFSYISIQNRESGKQASKEETELIRKSPAFKKASRLIIPMAPFHQEGWGEKLKEWKLLYSPKKKGLYPVGDNPIITREENDHDPFRCLDEFIFPISNRIILFKTNNSIYEGSPPEPDFTVLLGALMIKRSQRFIAHRNKRFLEQLIKYYQLHIKFRKEEDMVKNIFAMLKK
jgi:hypothetical protein